MAFNISEFKARGLVYGGARPTLFEVRTGIPPIGADAGTYDKFRFTCKASSIPAATVNSIDIGYFGRKIKVAGDRTFADWSVTVLNDEDFLVRAFFEKWSNSINNLISNFRNMDLEDYKVDMDIVHYDKLGDKMREYKVIGAFPTSVDAITLDWDNNNQIEQFGVTFAYDYWVPTIEQNNSYLGET